MFTTLSNIDNIQTKINEEKLVFLYVTQPDCSVCHGLLPQIEQIMNAFPDIHCYTIDASVVPEMASAFQVFTAPTLLLFADGKEYIREARFVQTEKFREKVEQIYQNVT